MNNRCTEYGYLSKNHVGEFLCGDHVVVQQPDDETCVLVLADGMGSGIKANILATLTATMMSRMISEQIPIDDCVKTIVSTLPECSERGVAYSTFTVLVSRRDSQIEIINYDNPLPFLIRDKQAVLPDYTYIEVSGKKIARAALDVRENDFVVAMSDGVIHAGTGEILNYGWEEPQVMAYLENICQPDTSAKALATTLVDRCNFLYGNEPGDDVTCAVMKIRERKHASVMVGPPTNPSDDENMAALFFARRGKHIVCGGTTASIVGKYLGRTVEAVQTKDSGDVPPISRIEGVDLVTEGVVTLNKVLEYGQNYLGSNEMYFDWFYKTDGAALLAAALFEEASDIHFYIGCAVNPAHQTNRKLGISLKMKLIDEIVDVLRKMNKNVQVNYF